MAETVIDGIDYGPLALMIGVWKGDKGMDIAPESDGSIEENPFYEEVIFEPGGGVTNANQQKLSIVRYYQKVFRKSNGEQFHDQVGYWLWDADARTIMFTMVIPRAVALVAGGSFDMAQLRDNAFIVQVSCEDGGDWGVAQSPFMRDNARTKGFAMTMEVSGDNMTYAQTTYLDIYGKSFDHTDTSTLQRV